MRRSAKCESSGHYGSTESSQFRTLDDIPPSLQLSLSVPPRIRPPRPALLQSCKAPWPAFESRHLRRIPCVRVRLLCVFRSPFVQGTRSGMFRHALRLSVSKISSMDGGWAVLLPCPSGISRFVVGTRPSLVCLPSVPGTVNLESSSVL